MSKEKINIKGINYNQTDSTIIITDEKIINTDDNSSKTIKSRYRLKVPRTPFFNNLFEKYKENISDNPTDTDTTYDFSKFTGFYYLDERNYYGIFYITDDGKVLSLGAGNYYMEPNSSDSRYVYEFTDELANEALNGESSWEDVPYSQYGKVDAVMLTDDDRNKFLKSIKDFTINNYSDEEIPQEYRKYIKPITYAPSWNNAFADEFVVKVDITSGGYSNFPNILESRTDINGNTFTPDKDHAYLVKRYYYSMWYFYNGTEIIAKTNTYTGLNGSPSSVHTFFEVMDDGSIKYTGVKYFQSTTGPKEGDIDEFTFGPATTDELAGYAYYTFLCSSYLGYRYIRALNNENPKILLDMPAFPFNEGVGVAYYSSDDNYDGINYLDINNHNLVPMYNPNNYSITIVSNEISESDVKDSMWILGDEGYMGLYSDHSGLIYIMGLDMPLSWHIDNGNLSLDLDFTEDEMNDIGFPPGTGFIVDSYKASSHTLNIGLALNGSIMMTFPCKKEMPDQIPSIILNTPKYLEYSSNDSFSLFSIGQFHGTKNWDGELQYAVGSIPVDDDDWTIWNVDDQISAEWDENNNDGYHIYLRAHPDHPNTYIESMLDDRDTRMCLYTDSWGGGVWLSGNLMALFNSTTPYEAVLSTEKSPAEYLFANDNSISDIRDLVIGIDVIPSNTDKCFAYLFYNCRNLYHAGLKLPARTLAKNCYEGMFYQCENAPNFPTLLPATNLAPGCYSYMFYGCNRLNSAIILPANTLPDAVEEGKGVYAYMFANCENFYNAPILPAKNLGTYCYNSMFLGCNVLSTPLKYIKAKHIPKGACNSMFQGCALYAPSRLYATSIDDIGCANMFKDCNISMSENLNEDEGCTCYYRLPVNGSISSLGNNALDNMFENSNFYSDSDDYEHWIKDSSPVVVNGVWEGYTRN